MAEPGVTALTSLIGIIEALPSVPPKEVCVDWSEKLDLSLDSLQDTWLSLLVLLGHSGRDTPLYTQDTGI